MFIYTFKNIFESRGPRPAARGSRLLIRGSRVRLRARLRPWLKTIVLPPLGHRTRVKHFLFGLVADPKAHRSGVQTPAHLCRPTARGSGRGSGHGSMLPISLPYLLGLGSSTTFLSPWPIPRLPARAFLPQLGCVGPRLGARLWPWLYATKCLPFAPRTRVKHLLFELVANPTAHGSRFGARLRPWHFATCSPLSQIACVLPRYPRGKLKCGLSYAIFRFSKVTIFSAKYRSITPFHAS